MALPELPSTEAAATPSSEAPGAVRRAEALIAGTEPTADPEARAAVARLQGLAQLLADTKEAARVAAEAESDPCRAAYASNVAAQRVSAEIAARHALPIPAWQVLAEPAYLAACAALPSELRACARYDRRIGARESCDALERAADEATRARYRTLVPPRRD